LFNRRIANFWLSKQSFYKNVFEIILISYIKDPREWMKGKKVPVARVHQIIFFFCAPWAYYTEFSGAGVVSGTLHPAVWDTHISS
jgi:hypothetical protein